MNNLQRKFVVLTLCAAALTLLPTTTAALTIILATGKARHVHSVSGFVVHVDQDRRSITLHWFREWIASYMAHITESNQAFFRVAEGVVVKNGSWSNLVKGAKVRLIGEGNLVDKIKLLK